MKIYKLGLVILVMTLTGCSSMNSSFDCPNKAGVNCKSMDQINTMVDSGQLPTAGCSSCCSSANDKSADFTPYPTTISYSPGQPIRYGESVQRIWVAPFEDNDGNYHQDSMMYSVVKGGHWIGKPVKEVTSL